MLEAGLYDWLKMLGHATVEVGPMVLEANYQTRNASILQMCTKMQVLNPSEVPNE